MIILLATLLLGLAIVLLGGTILTYLMAPAPHPARRVEIRRLRQAGLAVNQEGEA